MGAHSLSPESTPVLGLPAQHLLYIHESIQGERSPCQEDQATNCCLAPVAHSSIQIEAAGDPLSGLPEELFAMICAMVSSINGAATAMLRGASKPLCDAHDACNRRLSLGGREPPVADAGSPDLGLLTRVMQRTVQLDALVVQAWISWRVASKLLRAPLLYDLTSRLLELRLNACSNLPDLSVLSAFAPTLQHLDVGSCRKLADLGPLSAFIALRHLVLSSNPRVVELQPLSHCLSLQHL